MLESSLSGRNREKRPCQASSSPLMRPAASRAVPCGPSPITRAAQREPKQSNRSIASAVTITTERSSQRSRLFRLLRCRSSWIRATRILRRRIRRRRIPPPMTRRPRSILSWWSIRPCPAIRSSSTSSPWSRPRRVGPRRTRGRGRAPRRAARRSSGRPRRRGRGRGPRPNGGSRVPAGAVHPRCWLAILLAASCWGVTGPPPCGVWGRSRAGGRAAARAPAAPPPPPSPGTTTAPRRCPRRASGRARAPTRAR